MLPPELIDKIFCFLRKDTPALRACSKAHPFYSKLAERHLYADIVVARDTASDLLHLLNENPHFLNYPLTLEFYSNVTSLFGLSIMALIPRMANLMSLKLISFPCPLDHYSEFISTFRNCLQQSSIEQLHLGYLYDFPLSVLDNSKTIKTLSLSGCTGEDEPIPSVSPSQETLESLILSGDYIPDLCIWGMHRVTRLRSLGLRGWPVLVQDLELPAFPELLTACSNSLTTLHLEINCDYSSQYICVVPGWIHNPLHLPFTLSALTHLKSLSVFGIIGISDAKIGCALPEIIRLVNTAPAIQHVVLSFHCHVAGSITTLGLLDWSLLNLQSNSTGARPRIELCITGEGLVGPSFSPESILDALAGNNVLMGLVTRGLLILKSDRPLALWDSAF